MSSSCRRHVAVLGSLALFSLLAQAASADGARVWRRSELRRGVGDSAVRVLAVEARSAQPGERAGRIAVGGEDGVTLWRSGDGGVGPTDVGVDAGGEAGRLAETRRLSQTTHVHDLHFAGDGALWIATARGLWRFDSDGRLADRSPGPGEAARFIHRVASLSGVTFAATQSGAYATSDGRRWIRLPGDLPLGSAGPLAVRRGQGSADARALEVWLVVRGVLRRVELLPPMQPGAAIERGDPTRGRWAVSRSERLPPVSGLGAGAIPLQILLDWPDQDAALLYEHAIAVRSEPGAHWEVVRPVLPPEAVAVWLARAGGDYWLATDRGLLRARHWRGPWRRAVPPVGSAEVHRVAGAGEQVLAATGQGLFVGRAAPQLSLQRASVLTAEETSAPTFVDPPVRAVQRAALRYLGLGAEDTRDLRRGIARRGWLPLLSARVAGATDRDVGYDHDEAFLSGATRQLYDRDWHRGRDFEVSLSLTWDLRDIAYDPESIDLSREARQLISLRDDVLDQINQAYFERQALLSALEAAPAEPEQSEAERYKLRLRADELAAGLDGWTGGWFGQQAAGKSPALLVD